MAVSAFVSCGNNKEFTSGRAEDAIEDLPMFQDSANVTTLKVGYYEENDAAVRYKLRQLAANEMLTYSAEQINEYIPASYWNRAKTKEHVFITVSLTEKGKKYIVNEPIKDKESKELENKNIDTGMGLERLAVVMQDVDSVFDIDTMKAIRDLSLIHI